MTIGFLFWLLMVLWIFSWLFSSWGAWAGPPRYPWAIHGFNLLFFILLFLVGWKVFGFVIHE